MEREDVRALAAKISRGLLGAAIAVATLSALIVGEMAVSLDDELGAFDRDLGFTD